MTIKGLVRSKKLVVGKVLKKNHSKILVDAKKVACLKKSNERQVGNNNKGTCRTDQQTILFNSFLKQHG